MKKFTLLELLVVVAIIGILASLLLPSLSKARKSAETAVCLSNLRQIGIAQQLFVSDEQKYPYVGWFIPTMVKNNNSALSEIHMKLLPYTSDVENEVSKLFACPGFSQNIDGSGIEESHNYMNEGLIIDEEEQYIWDGVGANPLRVYGKPEHSTLPGSMHDIVNPSKTYSIHEIFSLDGTGWGKQSGIPFHGYKGARAQRNALFFDGSANTVSWMPTRPYQ